MAENELTEAEVAQLRALLLADNRRQWLVSGLKGVAGWITALAGGYLAFKGLITEFFTGVFK